MRVVFVAALALLLAAPALSAAEPMTLVIDDPSLEAEAGGDDVRSLVTIQADCPISGTARLSFTAQSDLGVRLYPEEITWQRCTNQARSQVFAALFVRPRAGVASGLYPGTMTVTAKDGQSASADFSVRIPYSATVGFQGPKITQVRSGDTVTQLFNVTVTTNGATEVAMTVRAPEGWSASAPASVSTTRVGTVQRLAWPVTLVVPENATGDGKVVFTAVPGSADGTDTLEPVTYDWFARVPVESEQFDAADAAAPASEEGLPAWVVGLGLIAGASLALWWTRR